MNRVFKSMQNDVKRRDFLQLGVTGLAATQVGTLSGLVQAAQPASLPRSGSFGRARSVIVMFTWGGMSHLDTFDMKPDAGSEIRGEFNPIASRVPGTQVCEHLPKMAQMMQHLAILRSVHHEASDHRKAAYWNITGHPPSEIGGGVAAPVLPSRQDWPGLGAQVAMAMKADRRYALRAQVDRQDPQQFAEEVPPGSIDWENLTKISKCSLSTEVLGPGHFPVGSFGNQDGYTNNDTVELIGMIAVSEASNVPVTRQTQGPVTDFSEQVSGDSTAGDWGSDTHGRGGHLWLIGDQVKNAPRAGFGCHANKFITFDLEKVRQKHFAASEHDFVVSLRFGVCGNPGVPPVAAGLAGVWLDGVQARVSSVVSRDDPSELLEVPVRKEVRYLTLAMLNGDGSTSYDDLVLADVELHEVTGELPELPKSQEEAEIEAVPVSEELAANLPRCISIPYPLADRGLLNGQYGGFLGMEYDPVFVHPGRGDPFKGRSPVSGTVDLKPQGVSRRRMAERSLLLDDLNLQFPWEDREAGPSRTQASQNQALNMMLSADVQLAFDLRREERQVRDLYGDHVAGQSALLARRLTDAGVPLVMVNAGSGDLNGGSGDHWDTHGNNFVRLRNDLLPPWDHAASSLLQDLIQSGRIDDTLVVFLGEFGRTPRINGGAGRDHFPSCYTVALAGAGVAGGLVYGKSDATASTPVEAACRPEDIHATIFHALGIRPEYQIYDQEDRPLLMCDGTSLPIFA